MPGEALLRENQFYEKDKLMKIKQLAFLILALFLSHAVSAQTATSQKLLSSADVLAFNQSESEYKELQKELKQLEKQRKDLLDRMATLDAQQKELVMRTEKLEAVYDGLNTKAVSKSSGKKTSLAPVGSLTKQFQETQMSFNLQYLQLQQQMQNENRSYTAISNIMKTKHDTAKNSISNVR